MFEQKKIAEALDWLFGLYPEDRFRYAKESYAEEFESISADLLARKYTRDAHEVCEYNVINHIGEESEYQGRPILVLKAACVAEEAESELETEQFRVEQFWELWLLEDMTFVTVFNTRVFVKTNGEVSSVVESRAYLNNVEDYATLPVSPESLIWNMDDDCMFEEILSAKEADASEGQAE